MQRIMHFPAASSFRTGMLPVTSSPAFPVCVLPLTRDQASHPQSVQAKLLLYFYVFVFTCSMGNLKIRNWMLMSGSILWEIV